jgi:hypothetical protein
LRFKKYLTEARDTTKGKGVTREDAKVIYKQLQRALRPDMSQQLSKSKFRENEWWDMDFRVYDLFTERPGEEDDDWPNFTGAKQLEKAIKPILKGIGYMVSPSEKSWLSILVKAKKMTKKELKVDARKPKEAVWRKLRFAEVDTYDKYRKEQYNKTSAALKKHRNKFIKKEQFFELAKKADFGWDDTELENFWGDIK